MTILHMPSFGDIYLILHTFLRRWQINFTWIFNIEKTAKRSAKERSAYSITSLMRSCSCIVFFPWNHCIIESLNYVVDELHNIRHVWRVCVFFLPRWMPTICCAVVLETDSCPKIGSVTCTIQTNKWTMKQREKEISSYHLCTRLSGHNDVIQVWPIQGEAFSISQ